MGRIVTEKIARIAREITYRSNRIECARSISPTSYSIFSRMLCSILCDTMWNKLKEDEVVLIIATTGAC